MKTLGIGFIGGGFITRFHIQSMLGVRDCEVLGVMSKTKSSAEESALLANRIGVGDAKPYDTVTEMVADPEINALWICAPNFTRIEIIEEIVSASFSIIYSLELILLSLKYFINTSTFQSISKILIRINISTY